MAKRDLVWLYYPMSSSSSVFSCRRSLGELFRYGLIGILSNMAGYTFYLLITYLGAAPKISMSILYVVGAMIGFWGNRKLTFSHNGSLMKAGFLYIVAHLLGYLINLTILVVMVDRLGYAHQLVQAAAIFTVAAYLFVVFKFIVFRTPDNFGALDD